MKHLRLVFASLAVVAAGTWAIAAVACDQKSASAANGACTPMSSAECKARMAAGQVCPMHGATTTTAVTAAASGECAAHATQTAASTACAHGASAGGKCPYSGASATTASVSGCTAHSTTATTASVSGCTAHGASATSAGTTHVPANCPAHTVNAMTVANTPGTTTGHPGCSSKTSTTAARGTCAEHGVSAMAAGLGSNCTAKDAQASTTAARAGCDACSDLSACQAELEAAGASIQTVPIKNGVMFVYTAASPGQVNAIQSVMSRRTEHLSRILASGDGAHLCGDCRSMRGAMVSGRLVREVVNIEGGTLVLMTSDDPQLVKRIRTLADAGKTAVKS